MLDRFKDIWEDMNKMKNAGEEIKCKCPMRTGVINEKIWAGSNRKERKYRIEKNEEWNSDKNRILHAFCTFAQDKCKTWRHTLSFILSLKWNPHKMQKYPALVRFVEFFFCLEMCRIL